MERVVVFEEMVFILVLDVPLTDNVTLGNLTFPLVPKFYEMQMSL